MSEIESISQGNYILHNIDAKKLYVQEPLFTANSGDAVYVGWRPDETVLYDDYTGRPATIGGQITLSESPLNFEYIDVYLNGSSPNGFTNISNGYEKIPNIQLSNTNSLEFVKLFAANNTTEGVHEVGCGYSGISGTIWTKWFGYVTNVNFTGAARKAEFGNPTHLNIWRVVGVNRKENA